MLATIPSAALLGVEGFPVTVEVHVSGGLPSFGIVGLPDATCREARDRVRAALVSCGQELPRRRVTVNLAPSGLRKSGAGLDLAIAVGVLVAAEVLTAGDVAGTAFVGELGLDGSIRSIPGVLAMVDALETPMVVVPLATRAEAELVGRHTVRAVATLGELVEVLAGRAPWPDPPPPPPPELIPELPDLADVAGQPVARRALELAAAGAHHVLMVGPPGAGKTMLARRLPSLLGELEPEVALEATRVHSAAGIALPAGGLVRRPPFRAPHHGLSAVALVGGGSASINPGELSIAHGGVLFMDELAEFAVGVLESLRQPLEEGVIRVARAAHRATMPARVLLVAAMNPCPCGHGDEPGACRCGPAALARYARRLSGPLLDRFDLRIRVTRPEPDLLLDRRRGESSAAVAERVQVARASAARRGVRANAHLRGAALDELAPLAPDATEVLRRAVAAGQLSGRGVERVRVVALTIADLAGLEPPLQASQVREALALRAPVATIASRLAG